jgi:hypothetical protein
MQVFSILLVLDSKFLNEQLSGKFKSLIERKIYRLLGFRFGLSGSSVELVSGLDTNAGPREVGKLIGCEF